MSTVGYINVSMELWGSLLSVIVGLCLCIQKTEQDKQTRRFFLLLTLNALVLVSDACAWLFKGRPGPLSFYMVRISNLIVFAAGYMVLTAFTDYLTCTLGAKAPVSRLPLYVVRGLCAAAVAMVVFSQFNHLFYLIDGQNVYHRQDGFWISQIGGIAGMAVNAGLLIRYRKNVSRPEWIALFSFVALPVAAMIVQIFVYGVALLNLTITLSILVLFLFIQVDQTRRQKERELELMDARVALMLTQIQPHFLYNVLTAIKQLCESDPRQAQEAVVEFSFYLRSNLDALTLKGNIPFEQEMRQVQNYMSLERKRFGDIVCARYDLRASGFFIPPLTVQPCVENAVRHGVTKKEGGGTVLISSREEEKAFVVTVSDDGLTGEGVRPGLEDVEKRVEALVGARFQIESRPGEGTSVTITIPKGEIQRCG